MDFTISTEESSNILMEPTPNTPAPINQKGADAEAEYARMISDPTHQHYDAFRRGDRVAEEYANALFRNAYGTAPVPIESQDVSATDPSGDLQAQAECEANLRVEFGESYDATMQGMQQGATYLFDGDNGCTALTVLSERISALGPKAEALGIQFLADLAKLQHTT